MVKKWGQRIYLAVIFLFLYLPFLVLIVLSFNNSKSRVVWGGFTLKWYAFLFYGRDHHECVCDNSTGHTHRSHRLDRHRNACRDRHQCHEKKNRTIMLGATPMYAFYKVTWPEIKSGVFSGFLMTVTMSLDDFSITFFTKGAGVNTLSTMLYTELRKGVRPELYALSTILFLFAFLLLLVMNCRSDRIAGNHAGIH